MEKRIFSHRGRITGKERGNLISDIFSEKVKSIGNVEIDIRKTKDGRYILFHDDCIYHKDVYYKISEKTYFEILDIALQNSFSINTIEDILENKELFIDFELKERGYELELVQIILENLNVDNFIITSFHWDVIKNIRKQFPNVKTGILIENEDEYNEFIKLMNNNEEFFDYLLPSLVLYRKMPVELKKKSNFIIWTVNNQQDMEKLKEDPFITGIITDIIS
ncbi:MAG: glycerophosphodiester phosphodiesterase [Candidatus Muirbacterium halophilum]|nr:glycerophosphodiester phosphodiesterase [Candidatus Muirbacterium halophilum]MCK9476713.1 glycerophosphodiester phosphodiesterase [Candidatus Muirbacterium halophilum]